MDSGGEEKRERSCRWIKRMPLKKYFRESWVIRAALKTRKIGEDDPRRILHSIKVGLALTLVSLLYYSRPLYDGFGSSGIWAVLTVIVIFEFTVGATLSKGLNRGIATTLGGALGTGAKFVTSLFGHKEEEAILLCVLLFLLAAVSTFTRFFPHIKKKYDYGVLIFILTFSLVAVSGYRVDKIVDLAHQRLSTIIIGGATCIVISIFVCPVWAGEDLHNQVALNVEKLANFLQGFGSEYFRCEDADDDCKDDKSFLEGYKSVLNSKPNEESLANFAWWEPGHGSFMFRHPWNQYLKIGALARQCAYQLEALNAYLSSDLQAPTEFERRIRKPCMKISSESGKALKELSLGMKTMTHPSAANTHLQNCKIAIEELKAAMELTSLEKEDLSRIVPVVTVASTLICIIKCVEEIAASIYELSEKARFKTILKSTLTSEKVPQLLHRGIVKPINDADAELYTMIQVNGSSLDSMKNDKISGQKSTVTVLKKPKSDCDGDSDGNGGHSTVITVQESSTFPMEKGGNREESTVTPYMTTYLQTR